MRAFPNALSDIWFHTQISMTCLQTSEQLRTRAKDRQEVRASGIVTHRQRPGTAKGVILASLEDETGTVNIIVWPQVAEKQRRVLLDARLLSVEGT